MIDKVNHMPEITTEQYAEHIFERLHVLMHQYRQLQYQTFKNHPAQLSHQEHKVLFFFQRRAGATLSDLVEHSGRDKAQLTRLIKQLKEKNLLQGLSCEQDKRRTQLWLTDKATALLVELSAQIQCVNQHAIAEISTDVLQQLEQGLALLQQNLNVTLQHSERLFTEPSR